MLVSTRCRCSALAAYIFFPGLSGYLSVLGLNSGLSLVAPLAAAETAGMASAAAPAAVHVSAVSGGGSAASLVDSYSSGVGGAGVSAGLGRAGVVGGLSVPQSWATASPAVRLVATALPMDGVGAWAGSGAPGGMFNGMCPVGSVVNTSRNSEPRSRADSRLQVMAQMPGESGVGENTPGRWVGLDQHAPHHASALSERDELNDLRMAIAAVAKERDVLKRSADRFVEEANKAMQR
jgi:PPE-SVP subfamily C-terminal region